MELKRRALALGAFLLASAPTLAGAVNLGGPYPILSTAVSSACFEVELCLDNPYTPGSCTTRYWFSTAVPASGTYNSLYNSTVAIVATAQATAQPIYITYTSTGPLCGATYLFSQVANGKIY